MSKRVRSDQKARSKSRSMTSAPAPRFRLFCQPNLLEGEDGAAYDELLARVCAAVKPVDIIEEIFISDLVTLEWEVLRWNRLKWSLIRAHGLARLEQFLGQDLLITSYVRDTLRTSLQNFFRPIFPTTKRIMRRRWPKSVPRMNRTLSTGSKKYSPTLASTPAPFGT